MKLRVIRDDNDYHQLQLAVSVSYSYEGWVTIDRYWYESHAVDEMKKRLEREREYLKARTVNAIIAEGEA